MGITNSGVGGLRVWGEGFPESVEGDTYGEGQNLSDGGVFKILIGRIPPSVPIGLSTDQACDVGAMNEGNIPGRD